MIVNYKDTGWEIITQRAHGIVAAQVAMNWKEKDRPKRWLETLLAIAEHDDAEVELEKDDLVTETGGPVNFAMKKFELLHCQHQEKLTISKSRYIALLASMHMEFLYRKEAHENKEAHAFLAQQNKLRAAWRKDLGISEAEAKKIYYLLEWCDAFSLILCRQQVQPECRAIEISTGPDGVVYNLTQAEDGKLNIDPWPFEPDQFTIYYDSRNISQLKFTDAAEFRDAFLKAPVEEVVWHVAKKTGKVKRPSKVKENSSD